MKEENKQRYISVFELAKILGVSRITVFNRIKKGQVPAEKIGRSYAIPMEYVEKILTDGEYKILTTKEKKEIERAVEKIVKEYGETLRLLGDE